MQVIPLFPLPVVFFPGEKLPLHIFETRYLDMLHYCRTTGESFGIASVVNKKVSSVGCLARITEVSEALEDGSFDIVCEGVDRFLVHQFITDKSYLQAKVSFFKDEHEVLGISEATLEIAKLFEQIKAMIQRDLGLEDLKTPTNSFEYAHYVGFDLAQKQNLLEIKSEIERIEYIKTHLLDVVPKLIAYEQVKARIQMNGHFRHFPPTHINPEHL